VVNTVTVSGGGEVNTGNDVAQDLTTILPPPVPDLTINKIHSNNFVQGQTGTYQIFVTNVGTKVTSGTVTVTDTLPTGLSAVSMTGIGWSCTLGTPLTCTSSDAVDFNFSFQTITLVVNVALGAPASVTNTATVSGGGDTNSANNTVNDFTLIAAPLVDLAPSVSVTGFASQGQTNVNAAVFVNNVGNIASNGAVTAVATLSSGLTASAISGTGWNCTLNNLTCTRSDAVSAGGGFPQINITFNIASNAPANATVSANISGGGDGNSVNNTASSGISIAPIVGVNAIGFVTQTVNAGGFAVFQLDVNPLSNAGGPATLTCSGLPTGASCSFSPNSAPPGVGGVVVNMTVTTTARTALVTHLPGDRQNNRPLLPLLFLSLSAVTAFWFRYRVAQGRRFKPALALTGLLLLAVIAGCGGGGGGGSNTIITNPQGTPAGTYTITAVATAPNGSNSATVTLVVK
jgi:uncharacterized repeat protein (TIGR01451 family)